MSDLLLVAPILLPLVAAIAGTLAPRGPGVQRAVGMAGSLALLAASVALLVEVEGRGVVALQVGSWPAPFGITLVADLLSALMVTVTAVVAVAVTVYASAEIDDQTAARGFHPFVQVLLMGVCGAFLTGDLFNLYVWFEVMLLASFVLLATGRDPRSRTSGITYVSLNLLASGFFLAAVGLLYAEVGSLNLADLSLKLDSPRAQTQARPVAMLLMVAFGIKAGLFPVFFWLPASYPTAGFAVSALFAGLLTKVGVYALLRVFTLLFPLADGDAGLLLLGVAIATMASGVLAAASQRNVRAILSFHIISQIGYMVLGLALGTRFALAAAVFYLIHHIVTKTNLFLVSGLLGRDSGLPRGLVAVLFAIPALSLAGIPPLSGFFAKLLLLQAALEIEAVVSALAIVAVGLLTLYSMSKIWNGRFWESSDASLHAPGVALSRPGLALAASAGLAVIVVALGLGAELLWTLSERAAEQLSEPGAYVAGVLGAAR